MAPHPLDRPIWSALSTRQAAFALGGPQALRYAPDVEPFVASGDDTRESLEELANLIGAHGLSVMLQVGECPLPPRTKVEMSAAGVQMVAHAIQPADPIAPVERLSEADAGQMIELATLTKPGPFLPRTHELGAFWGVKQSGRLVAMAGERMKLPGYTEVSGVCTHPDARGKGYAGLLSRIVATHIARRGETPFLHAFASNTSAIRLYEQLGFRLRTAVTVTMLIPAT